LFFSPCVSNLFFPSPPLNLSRKFVPHLPFFTDSVLPRIMFAKLAGGIHEPSVPWLSPMSLPCLPSLSSSRDGQCGRFTTSRWRPPQSLSVFLRALTCRIGPFPLSFVSFGRSPFYWYHLGTAAQCGPPAHMSQPIRVVRGPPVCLFAILPICPLSGRDPRLLSLIFYPMSVRLFVSLCVLSHFRESFPSPRVERRSWSLTPTL